MKTVLTIFIEQFRSGEVWKRFWDFNKLKPFKVWTEYRERTSRRITIEDAPALFVTFVCGIGLISALYYGSFYFNVGRAFSFFVIAAFIATNVSHSRKG